DHSCSGAAYQGPRMKKGMLCQAKDTDTPTVRPFYGAQKARKTQRNHRSQARPQKLLTIAVREQLIRKPRMKKAKAGFISAELREYQIPQSRRQIVHQGTF